LKAGLKIVACNAASKIPHKGICPRGADSATDSYAEVMRWFDKDPTINLAALMKGSDVLVFDIDGPKGREALKKLGAFPKTRMTKTRNGEHHFVRYSGPAIGSRIKLFPELDIIASGYVMLPGSVHPDGGVYECDDIDASIADIPSRMLAVIRKAKSKEKAEGGGEGLIKKGKSNDRLAAIAGALRRQGLDADLIDTTLQMVNDEHCDPPLPEDEVTRPFLAELGAIACNTGAAIIGLRHITKGDKDKAIYSGLGSIDIVAAARSAIMIGLHPEDEDIRVFSHSKHNLSIRGDSLMYELADGNHRAGVMPRVKWSGTTELTANDLVSKKGGSGAAR
jgi:hypothetical protein